LSLKKITVEIIVDSIMGHRGSKCEGALNKKQTVKKIITEIRALLWSEVEFTEASAVRVVTSV